MTKPFEVVDWNEISRRGLLERINREIMHPLGLAVFRVVETGISGGALVSPDGKWCYPEDADVELTTETVISATRGVFESACRQHAEEAGYDPSVLDFSRDGNGYEHPSRQTAWWAWCEALQSEQVQAWKRDSERYKWLKEKFMIMSLDMEGNHKWVLQRPLQSRGPTMDAVCDDAMGKQI